METNKSNGLNVIAKIVIALVIVNHVSNVFTTLYYLSSRMVDIVIGVGTLIVGISMIVILAGVLNLKKWGVYAFFIIQITNVLILSIHSGNFVIHAFAGVMMCVVFSGLLMLKKNGISGWEALGMKYSSEEFVNNEDLKCSEKGTSDIDNRDCTLVINEYNDEEITFADKYVIPVFVICIFVILFIVIRLNLANIN